MIGCFLHFVVVMAYTTVYCTWSSQLFLFKTLLLSKQGHLYYSENSFDWKDNLLPYHWSRS